MATVVSHIAGDFDALARQALRQAALGDLVELRLDRIGHPGEGALGELIRQLSKPVIVTVQGQEAFGSFRGSVDERCEILLAASRAGAMFVDIDATLSLELGEVEGKCHRIVSRHDLEGTPTDLDAFDAEVREVLYEGDAVKLVTHARTTEDGLRMLQHLRAARGGLIAFCSGPAGSFTRVVAPIFGSPFTYAAPADLPGMEGREPTAPGQLRVNDLLGLLPPGGLSPETAVLGVVGNPIGHSLSPWVQGMALKSAHLDAVYVAFEPQDFARFLELAQDENFRGLSVTAPFKEDAYNAVAVRDEASERVKACNTLVRDGAGWRGYNTDLPAVKETLERAGHLHGQVPGRPVAIGAAHALVLGTGGAARAVIGALRELNTPVTVAGRDLAKARALATQLGCESIAWDAIPSGEFDVLVNCTPVGSEGAATGGELPIPEGWLGDDWLVLDAVYWPIRTPLLLAVKARGGTPVPGAEWFVRQAAAQFQLFTRQEADESLMRAAFENAVQPGAAPR
jgi:3-dehydroquinate dehydratase/shikimate dehydrogenase